jgi:hypothetical protein
MSCHTYDCLDGKPAADDLSRCSACDITAAKGTVRNARHHKTLC